MQKQPSGLRSARLIARLIAVYGLVILVDSLLHQVRSRSYYPVKGLVASLVGMSYVYLGVLLLRRKYNAWLVTLALSALTVLLSLARTMAVLPHVGTLEMVRVGLNTIIPLLVGLQLLQLRAVFAVRSDRVGFRQALLLSALVVGAAFIYGTIGFSLLDRRDFHREISVFTAAHLTVDQFGITTPDVVPHTVRARLFVDSLSAVSMSAGIYVVLAFFQPIRLRLRPQQVQRDIAERLLRQYPSDIDDFFKLWPHDKQYFFDVSGEAGLVYHVSRGVALVVGDPFGNPKKFLQLCWAFHDMCFVNDWRPAFVHVGDTHRSLYEKLGFRLQKIGEEAVLDISAFAEHRNDKYFRQIRNRFTKLGYRVELLEPPHSTALLSTLRAVTADWLTRPGRAERGFMMGYHTDEYLQQGSLAVVCDETGTARGFMNIVPTFEDGAANYDLLRCDSQVPGNCNDFLLLSTITLLEERGYHTLNLGLCPLKGLRETDGGSLSESSSTENSSTVGAALRFIYANGDRFYSFSGLERFKAKYHPQWDGRYVAYSGNPAVFARVMTALTRAMKVK